VAILIAQIEDVGSRKPAHSMSDAFVLIDLHFHGLDPIKNVADVVSDRIGISSSSRDDAK
jgi:hypothetical protein